MKLLHHLCWAILLIGLPMLTSAQQDTESEGVFAFAFNRAGKKATSAKISNHKIKNATKVFDNLVQAKGVKNMPRPLFIMENAERRPAWTNPSEAIVVLEEKAYDLCMGLGRDSLNALAALLAHELIHYYEKHDWRDRFEKENKNVLAYDDNHNQKQDLELELQADHLGGLLAHMAGYNTLGVMPELLPRIYDSYSLNHHKEESYPSLDERRSIAISSDIMLTKNSRIFDMSVYMTAAGSYEMAINYLNYLLVNTQFQSREIYNNLGVLSTLLALELMPADDVQFQLPIELDLESRLSTRAGNKDKIVQLLNNASYNFKNAIILDEEYAPALLNLASVYLLEMNYFDAGYYAQKALNIHSQNNDKNGKSNAFVLMGIVAAKKGMIDEARQKFIAADSELGRINLCFLRGDDDCLKLSRSNSSRDIIVDDVDLNQLYARIMRDQEQALLTIELDNTNSFHTIAKDNSEILISLNNADLGSYEFYQSISTGDLSYNENIKVGCSAQEVETSLGSPKIILSGIGKNIWVYRSSNLLIFLDEEEKVIEWCLFKSNQS